DRAWCEFGLRPRILRLARRGGSDIDDVPRHRFVAAQAIRAAVPALRGNRIDRQRQRPIAGPRPDREQALRALALDAGVVDVAIEAEEPHDGLVRRAVE